MPTYSVPIVRADGRTIPELVEAVSQAEAESKATVRGLVVNGNAALVGAGYRPPSREAQTMPIGPGADAHILLDRLSIAANRLVTLGLIIPPLLFVGIIFGMVGGGSKGARAVVFGLFILIVQSLAIGVLLFAKIR